MTANQSGGDTKQMLPFEYRFETSGERLYRFIRVWQGDAAPRQAMLEWLDRSGSGESWLEYIEQMSAVALTGRIVQAGRSIGKQYREDPKLYLREFRSYLNDKLSISKEDLDKLMRIAPAAVEVADGDIPSGLAAKMRHWASHNHSHCYLCGDGLDFTPNAQHDKIYTCEHIWPSSYGGDSKDSNFLPACSKCNGQKKRHFATWAMVNIQSVIRGLNPSKQEFNVVDGTPRFALHYLAGQRLAIRKKLTLKEAFRKIGPWTTLRVEDSSDIAHFFNLSIHNSTVDLD